MFWFWLNPLKCFFGSEGHVALDRNPGPGYDTLLLRMIPGDLLSAFPHRQFHTLPVLLDSWAILLNSNPMQGGSLYHFYDGLWYDTAERRTHDLPCERRKRYRLSQPDTVYMFCNNRVCLIVELRKTRFISPLFCSPIFILIIIINKHNPHNFRIRDNRSIIITPSINYCKDKNYFISY